MYTNILKCLSILKPKTCFLRNFNSNLLIKRSSWLPKSMIIYKILLLCSFSRFNQIHNGKFTCPNAQTKKKKEIVIHFHAHFNWNGHNSPELQCKFLSLGDVRRSSWNSFNRKYNPFTIIIINRLWYKMWAFCVLKIHYKWINCVDADF